MAYESLWDSPSTADVRDILSRMPARGWTVPGNGVGLVGKALGLFGLDAEGARGRQSWSDAAQQSLWDAAHFPDTMLESAAQAVTAPARAYRGEIPDDQMIPEGLNFAGSVALGSAAVPKPMGAAAKSAIPVPDLPHGQTPLLMPGEMPGYAGLISRIRDRGLRMGEPRIEDIPMSAIRATQEIESPNVVDSIASMGMRRPTPGDEPVLYKHGDVYYLADGRHRFAAAEKSGLDVFPGAKVRDVFSNPTESAAPGIAMTTASREQPQDLWNIMPWLPRAALWR